MVDGTGAGLSLLYSVRGRWAELLQQADRRFPWLVGMQHWQLGRAVSCTLYLVVCILMLFLLARVQPRGVMVAGQKTGE